MKDPTQIINWEDFYDSMRVHEDAVDSAYSESSDVCSFIDLYTLRVRVDLCNLFVREWVDAVPAVKEHSSALFDLGYSICVGYRSPKAWLVGEGSKKRLKSVWQEYRNKVAKLQKHGQVLLEDHRDALSLLEDMTLCEKLHDSGDSSSALIYVEKDGGTYVVKDADFAGGVFFSGQKPSTVRFDGPPLLERVLMEEQGGNEGKDVYLVQNLSSKVPSGRALMYAMRWLQEDYDAKNPLVAAERKQSRSAKAKALITEEQVFEEKEMLEKMGVVERVLN
ncbi:hypothetical protein ACFL3V_05675 [Nanoarchaeota archaeon]